MRFTYELSERMGMTAAELGDRMSAPEFERRLLLEQVRGEERRAQAEQDT